MREPAPRHDGQEVRMPRLRPPSPGCETDDRSAGVPPGHDKDSVPEDPPPGAATLAEATPENLFREFEHARVLAYKKGQAHAMVTATMAKARLAGVFHDKADPVPATPAKFDGNYAEAARRVAFLMRLAAHENSPGENAAPDAQGDPQDRPINARRTNTSMQSQGSFHSTPTAVQMDGSRDRHSLSRRDRRHPQEDAS
jgi:hypothetical protein